MRSHLKNRAAVSSVARAPSSDALENVPGMTSPCCASNEGSCFKENININKSETPKLALDPQQMKRKKKGGGNNLRKSLAWDRAFFTEEGVLDPLELSAISGASFREESPFIDEDTPSGSKLSTKPVNLQNLENILLKELEEEDLGKDRRKNWSSLKLDSASSNLGTSTSLTSHKVPTRVGSKSGPRCGDCPRPLPLSSLKRPANVNVGKAAGKELKLSKVHGLMPGLSPSCAKTKSNIPAAIHVKYNEVTQSGLQNSSKSFKNTQNASKASSLLSACYPDENSRFSFRRHSSINKSPVLVDKADTGPKTISGCMTPARSVHSFEGQHQPTTSAAPLFQNDHVSGRTMHHLQNQSIKPSGLRMPSPSLSFFSQPKPSVLHDLSLRGTRTDVGGFHRPGNLSLQDNLKRIPKTDISSNAMSTRSECRASSHASAVELIKSNLKRNSIQKIHDRSKHNVEKAELQKVDIEVPSQSGSCEQVMDDNFCKKFTDNYPVKSESCGSECRHAELISEPNHAINKSETITAIDVPRKEKNACNLLVLNHGAIKGTQLKDTFDRGVQDSLKIRSDWEETFKPDSDEPHREHAVRYSPGETDNITEEDKNLLKTNERASELGVSQQEGSWCVGNAGVEALEHEQVQAENLYLGSKNLHADLLKEAAFTEVLAGNLLGGDAHMQNALFASTIGGSKNRINLISEVVDDTKQSGKGSDIQDICTKIEINLHRNAGLNTSDSLLPEKQTCLRKSQQEKVVEKLLCEVSERNGKEMIETRTANPLPPGKMHYHGFGEMIGPIISTELGSVDNFLQPESQNNLISTTSNCDRKHKGDDSLDASLSETMMSLVAVGGRAHDDYDYRSNESDSMNSTDNVNLSNTLHQDAQRPEIDCYSSFHDSRTGEVSPKNIPGKVIEVGPIIQDEKEGESDMDNLRNVRHSKIRLVQSPESNMLNECRFKQSEHMALPNAEIVAENLAHGDGGLHFENYLLTKSLDDGSYEDNALGSMEDYVTRANETPLRSLENPCVSVQESPFKHETCNDVCRAGSRSPISDATADPSRFELTEISEETSSSFSCLHPGLDHLKVEAALAPNNNNGDGVDEKSRSFVPPQNAIPFSDEWLAAIEAVGEDILTRKGGAVQNSPPDKSLPEPSPWSPVKKKNNPIGPFDCTKKFTNIPSSDSN